MKLYIFRSETKADLRAFCPDVAGSKLPDHFKPWRAIGVVRPETAPPHNLPRAEIEKSIESLGFQLWRVKET
ncbi:MAG TPA: hypothetical protein VKS78_14935 [Roseiarcus sp.]|nr:hypothetical protein [Roseiarcus sp.]